MILIPLDEMDPGRDVLVFDDDHIHVLGGVRYGVGEGFIHSHGLMSMHSHVHQPQESVILTESEGLDPNWRDRPMKLEPSESNPIRSAWERGETIKLHVRGIIESLGLDPDNQHFARTPERFAKVMRAYVQEIDLDAVLSGGFEDDDPAQEDEKSEKTLVVQTAIPFMGLCAHHLLPFFGSAAVGYLPRDRVVGLSKLTRLVYAAGHLAPTTQEHITNLVADTLARSKTINPKGVAVLTSALHGCMAVRGVEAPGTRTIASAIRGEFQEVPALEDKFMVLAMKGLD